MEYDKAKVEAFQNGMADKEAARERSRTKTYQSPAQIRQQNQDRRRSPEGQKSGSVWFEMDKEQS